MAKKWQTWNTLGNSELVHTHNYPWRKNKTGRDKYKCIHYDTRTGLCNRINIGCVGPNNPLCPDYATSYNESRTAESAQKTEHIFDVPDIYVGMPVKHINGGTGKIIAINKDGQHITVSIKGNTMEFPVPGAFAKGHLQKWIEDENIEMPKPAQTNKESIILKMVSEPIKRGRIPKIKNDRYGIMTGVKVMHKSPLVGTGVITRIDGNKKYVYVSFQHGVKAFVYPDAFDKGILKIIKNKK